MEDPKSAENPDTTGIAPASACRGESAFTRVFHARWHAHGCSAEHPNVSRRSAHPSFGVSEAKPQTPGAKNAPRERDGLFDIVSRTEMRCCLHPEERAPSVVLQSRTRVRASRRMRTCDWVRPHASRRIAAQPRPWGRLCFHLRCDAPQHEGAGAKHQLAAVRNDRRGTFIVSGLLFTMTFATPTCWPHRALKIMQGHTRAGVPSGAAVTFEPVVH